MKLIKGKLCIFILSAFLSVSAIGSELDYNLVLRLANQGDATAQFNLGVMYGKGQGVHQDYHKAKELYGVACDNGLQRGCNAYRVLNQRGI